MDRRETNGKRGDCPESAQRFRKKKSGEAQKVKSEKTVSTNLRGVPTAQFNRIGESREKRENHLIGFLMPTGFETSWERGKMSIFR